MPVSLESVTSNSPQGGGSARILIVSLSWLGDCVMAMPAVGAFRKRLPGCHIAMLAKPSVAALWKLFPGVDEVIPLKTGFAGMRDTLRVVRKGGFDFAYVLPKSFRAAWIPFLARVPGRRGMPGHGRDWMLTETATLTATACAGHQSLEMADVLHVSHDNLASPPFLMIPDDAKEQARRRLEAAFGKDVPALPGALLDTVTWVAMFPGASYGPSKRWAADRFAAVGRELVEHKNCNILVLGAAGDKPVCDEVIGGLGPGAVNLAGETSFAELVALLSLCRCVVANDSGGMHLAAAVGVGVVGIFGVTDPAKTAPVGPRTRVITAQGVERSRDLARDSVAAREAMQSISVEEVVKAVSAWV